MTIILELSPLVKQLKEYSQTKKLPTKQMEKLFQKNIVDVLSRATTIIDDQHVFIATGDIPAMWLRDATFQVLPYIELLDNINGLDELIKGTLRQELKYVQIDPYANAFNLSASGAHWSDDDTDIPVSDWVWERKFEVDSLCAPIFLAVKYFEASGDNTVWDESFWKTLRIIINVFQKEQNHEKSSYYFNRVNCPPSDSLSRDGRGTKVSYTGMIWNGFRPSDDACKYGYLVPSNMFAVSVLRSVRKYIPIDKNSLRSDIDQMILEIQAGIKKYAIKSLPSGELGFAYEVDGLGHANFMDDANVPSLLSLPFVGYINESDELYKQTQRFILSDKNPYFYSGKVLSGIGSAHTPEKYVWPISIAMQGLISQSKSVQAAQAQMIAMTTDGTEQSHEGIHIDDPHQYTREWFSWSNMTYIQLILKWLIH